VEVTRSKSDDISVACDRTRTEAVKHYAGSGMAAAT
jgi:hypothetical protein